MKKLSVQEAKTALSNVIYAMDEIQNHDLNDIEGFQEYIKENNFHELARRATKSKHSINCNNHIFQDLCTAISVYGIIWLTKSKEITDYTYKNL